MGADKCERYEISQVPGGLHVSLWQALPSVGAGVIALVILAACFMTDPYQGHGRIWAGLGVVALLLVAIFGVKRETWIISDSAVRYKGSLWSKELSFERAEGKPLVVRVELVPSDPEGNAPPFPHVVHLVGPGGIELGEGFHFRERSSVEGFLETLQNVARFEVKDLPSKTP